MTSLLISIKHRFPLVWRAVERVNGLLFALRFRDFDRHVGEVLDSQCGGAFDFLRAGADDAVRLSEFLRSQSAARLEYFNPHPFDAETLRRLGANRAFRMMKVVDRTDGEIAGYFFLRCFFVGKAFHGLIVDARHEGRGIGSAMWALSAEICRRAGLRMFATVAEHNLPSLASARRGTEVEVVERLANEYLLIECKPRTE